LATIVIVDKKLREFEKDQFWWGCHQTARAKKFWHFSSANGIVTLPAFPDSLRNRTWQRYFELDLVAIVNQERNGLVSTC
jgi:hypothetical protein